LTYPRPSCPEREIVFDACPMPFFGGTYVFHPSSPRPMGGALRALHDVLVVRFSTSVGMPEAFCGSRQGLSKRVNMATCLKTVKAVTVVRYSNGFEHNPGAYYVVSIAREEKAVPFEVRRFRAVVASLASGRRTKRIDVNRYASSARISVSLPVRTRGMPMFSKNGPGRTERLTAPPLLRYQSCIGEHPNAVANENALCSFK